jgi:hypothetical protein
MPHANDPNDQRVIDDVERYGLHITNILAEGELPPFSFTIGLYKTWRHPEVLIYGLKHESAQDILNGVADELRRGRAFSAGEEYEGLLEGYRCTFKPIPASQIAEHLGVASWFYEHEPFPASQLIYPDRSHRWPWDPGTTETFRRQQLVLADTQ